MANLLPKEIKKQQLHHLLNRKIVLIGVALMLLLVFTLVTLGSFWLSLFVRQQSFAKLVVKDDLTTEASLNLEKGNLLKKIKEETQLIENYWSEILLSSVIDKILALRPLEIKIFGLTLEREELGQKLKVVVVGQTPSRSKLVEYVNFLKQSKFFTRVDLPVENLLHEEGGQFILNLEK